MIVRIVVPAFVRVFVGFFARAFVPVAVPVARACAVLLLGMAGSAHASFHLWQIRELYSNADGSVQFIELTALAAGQQFISGRSITSTSGAQSKSFTFPSNLAGDSAEGGGTGYYGETTPTTYKSFLIGTAGFAALGGVQPDYVVPNGFLFLTNGAVNFAGTDMVTYAALPTADQLSYLRGGGTAVNSPTNFAGLTGVVTSAPTALNYTDLWWGGNSENGWGMTVQQHGNTQFNVFFVYDGSGKPIWYAMPGCNWNAAMTTCTGQLAKPVSAPLGNYNPASFVPGQAVGSVTIAYTGPNTANLQYTINGISGQKTIQRQIFGAVDNTAGLQVGDMWWGGTAQNGWGVSITQQYRTLFAAWYSYDQNGNVTWYTLPGGTWSGNVYSGTLATASGSPWLGATYNPGQFAPVAAGTVSFNFQDANTATMTYTFTSGPFAGITQTKSLVRQPF